MGIIDILSLAADLITILLFLASILKYGHIIFIKIIGFCKKI